MSALQSDFGKLAIPCEEGQPFDFADNLVVTQANPSISKVGYVPINQISKEAMAIIAAWEAAWEADTSSTHGVQAVVEESDDMYEPIRTMGISYDCSQPPKRFFRTFWRSLARRLVQVAKKRNHEGMECAE